jgi:hypothetical protein
VFTASVLVRKQAILRQAAAANPIYGWSVDARANDSRN